MAQPPFALWRQLGTGETPQSGPLVGIWLNEIAGIYESLSTRGIGPRAADELELWEIGAVFGLHRPDGEATTAGGGERDLVAERVAYLQGKGPKPEPDAPAPIDNLTASLVRPGRTREELTADGAR